MGSRAARKVIVLKRLKREDKKKCSPFPKTLKKNSSSFEFSLLNGFINSDLNRGTMRMNLELEKIHIILR